MVAGASTAGTALSRALAGLTLLALLAGCARGVTPSAAAAVPQQVVSAPTIGAVPEEAAPSPAPALLPVRLPAPVRTVVRFAVGGLLRTYVVVTPRHQMQPLPLVLALPGVRQTAALAEQLQGWDRYAAADLAVVVYGSSYGGGWDAGTCCVVDRPAVDDVAYLDGVLNRVLASHGVDRTRVLLAGFSNGGMMAYRYACERSSRIAGLAVVAATLAYGACRPTSAVGVLAVNGGRDETVPLAGTAYSTKLHARLAPPAQALLPWRRIASGLGVPVDLVVVRRLQHHWPTARSAGFDGTALVWRFLSARHLIGRHTAPPPSPATTGTPASQPPRRRVRR